MIRHYIYVLTHIYTLLSNDNIIKYTNNTSQGLVDLNFIWILQKT